MLLVAAKSITAIIGLLFVFFIHELGHYIAGRMFKLKIVEFSVGIGPVKFLPRFLDKNGTVWRMGLLPIGGYVRPLQRPSQEDSGPVYEAVSKLEEGISMVLEMLLRPFKSLGKFFYDKLDDEHVVKGKKYIDDLSPIESIVLAAAGPIFNFLLSITGFFMLYNFHGRNYVELEILKPSGNLEVQDRVLKINNRKLAKILQYRLFAESGQAEVQRNGETLLVDVDSMQVQAGKFVNSHTQRLSPILAIQYAIKDVSLLIIQAFLRLVKVGKTLSTLRGPLSIIKEGINFTSDIYTFTAWLFMISILLGTFNLLPIPPLDGGKVSLGILELCAPKKYHSLLKKAFNELALLIVLLLLFLVFKSDVLGLKR